MNNNFKKLAEEGSDVVIEKLHQLPSPLFGPIIYLIIFNEIKHYCMAPLDVPPLIYTLLEEGFEITITSTVNANTIRSNGPAYRISGFAKAGYFYLEETEDPKVMIGKGRYTQPLEIKSFSDILNVARECHKYNPEYGISGLWFKHFDNKGWVKKVEPTIGEYVMA